jgi:hypothetical protein
MPPTDTRVRGLRGAAVRLMPSSAPAHRSRRAPLVGSASGLDAAYDLGGELGVGQELVDERDKDLLSGDAGDTEAVGGFSLPDVEGSVCGGREVDGSSCSLAACSLVEFLSEVREALGRPRVRGYGCAEAPDTGFDAVGGSVHHGDPSLAEIRMSVCAPIRRPSLPPPYAVAGESACPGPSAPGTRLEGWSTRSPPMMSSL